MISKTWVAGRQSVARACMMTDAPGCANPLPYVLCLSVAPLDKVRNWGDTVIATIAGQPVFVTRSKKGEVSMPRA